jgi:hypothetical protein
VFEIGNRIRCLNSVNSHGLVKGSVYTVSGINNRQGFVLIKELPNNVLGFFDHRFELVTDEVFNVSTATDQELADEYRRLLDSRVPIFNELKNRGFTVKTKNSGVCITPIKGDNLAIYKSSMINL